MVLKRAGQKRRGPGGRRGWEDLALASLRVPVACSVAGMVESGRGRLSGTPTLEVWGRGLDLVGPQAQAAGVDIDVGWMRLPPGRPPPPGPHPALSAR